MKIGAPPMRSGAKGDGSGASGVGVVRVGVEWVGVVIVSSWRGTKVVPDVTVADTCDDGSGAMGVTRQFGGKCSGRLSSLGLGRALCGALGSTGISVAVVVVRKSDMLIPWFDSVWSVSVSVSSVLVEFCRDRGILGFSGLSFLFFFFPLV